MGVVGVREIAGAEESITGFEIPASFLACDKTFQGARPSTSISSTSLPPAHPRVSSSTSVHVRMQHTSSQFMHHRWHCRPHLIALLLHVLSRPQSSHH